MDKLCSKLLNYCLMKCSVQNMAVEVVCLAYAFLFGVAAFGPTPRTVWKVTETDLIMFRSPEVYNYSVLLLNEDSGVLYVGARDAIFALDMLDIQKIQKQVSWPVSEEKQNSCYTKGKSKETECRNYIRVLQQQDDSNLYVCGTYAFQPVCDRLSISEFTFEEKQEEGKGKCPFSPTQSYTSVMVDGELYAGTVNNYWGSEPIITRSSQQSTLRTEYSIPWLNEPNFVYADVVREKNLDGDDDKIYFFLTETAVEFEFFTKLLVPRIVRVCKGDQGGQRTLQKKWTSFLKAKLACFSPELNFVFNVVHDVFILKTPSWKDTVFYGVFTSQLNNAGVSAVCAFNMTSVETVFTKGTFMQSVICDQTQTKWLQSSKEIPSPRPGMCINNEARAQNINSSLQLPDKTLQFIKDHPLIYDPVTPVGNRPKLIKAGVNYTQIAVKRVQAFDGNLYDVLFLGTAEGALHKAVIYDTEVHIVEEVQLFSNRVPVETLLLSSKEGVNYLYASSSTGVVQSPLAFCENYKTCTDCILARDPLCAWNSGGNVCVSIYKPGLDQSLVQQLSGDSSTCKEVDEGYETYPVQILKPGEVAKMVCHIKSQLAYGIWKFNETEMIISTDSPKYYLHSEMLLIFNVSQGDYGLYECFSREKVKNKFHSHKMAGYILKAPPIVHHTATASVTSTIQITMESSMQSTTHSASSSAFTSNMDTTRNPTVELLSSTLETLPTTVAPLKTTFVVSTISAAEASQTVTCPSFQRVDYLESKDCGIYAAFLAIFCSLFLILLWYSFYKGFLPNVRSYCSALRSKKSTSELADCERGQKEGLMQKPCLNNVQSQQNEQPKSVHDSGYEMEPDCENGKLVHEETSQEAVTEKDKPFDVASNLKYVDSDGEE
ncbi:semaphorin-4D isoform X2 [Protopterus annectens]|uniref:semaphorin-4D isoform X2 n=1 Tax=Protopterus annectens TaxID=7888 RepID=UPI001CFAF43D|nr:semaphorin-4D isoform X2 [Protopterus annectens]